MSQGRRARTGHVSAHVIVGTSQDSRVGLIVGRNVGNSVQRHRVSRILRHAMRQALAEIPTHLDIVIRALPGAAAPRADIGTDAVSATLKAVEKL